MRVLVIGGTRFVGRHLVQAALDGGHDVTLFHRGRTGPRLFPDAEHRLGDRDHDLGALARGTWDATVDVCAYVPRQVRTLAHALGGRGGRYVYISSISAYAEPAGPGIVEDAALQPPPEPDTETVDGQTYGALKAACEAAATEVFDAGPLVIRPTYVVGPGDHTGRFTYWVRRIARGGEVLAPGPAHQPVQVVDARDLAGWVVSLVEGGAGGVFHAASPAPPFGLGDALDTVVSAVAGPGTVLRWVDADFLLAAGQDGRALPLWAEGDPSWLGAVDPSAAFASGLAPRPLADTVRDILADPHTPLVPGVGLAEDAEQKLLAHWRNA